MCGMVRLHVYIRDDCWTCAESHRIVADIAPQFPQLSVELIDIDQDDPPGNVFAVPTYILDGRIISLGNPYREELRKIIESVLNSNQM